MKINKQILSTTILLLVVVFVQGQTASNSSGGEASGSGGAVSYSVGQVSYQTHTGANGSISEGVQQSYEISTTTGLEEATGINLSVSAFPNPTTDYLTLEVDAEHSRSMNYQLYNMQGKLLQNKKITGIQTSIAMSNLVPATYFIKVIHENKEVKTFKIIKK